MLMKICDLVQSGAEIVVAMNQPDGSMWQLETPRQRKRLFCRGHEHSQQWQPKASRPTQSSSPTVITLKPGIQQPKPTPLLQKR
jgi:hypothetical protein